MPLQKGRRSNRPPVLEPESLRMRKEVFRSIKDRISIIQDENLDKVIPQIDVLYVTRIQKERFPDPTEYYKMKGVYKIDLNTLKTGKNDLIILHPLPRIDEISSEVDHTPQAKYFQQVWNGIVVRMALLSLVLAT